MCSLYPERVAISNSACPMVYFPHVLLSQNLKRDITSCDFNACTPMALWQKALMLCEASRSSIMIPIGGQAGEGGADGCLFGAVLGVPNVQTKSEMAALPLLSWGPTLWAKWLHNPVSSWCRDHNGCSAYVQEPYVCAHSPGPAACAACHLHDGTLHGYMMSSATAVAHPPLHHYALWAGCDLP